ncbi:DNA cytosine methyltransferase [Listeria monocytogenes]|nr:DNA cytosine methyltransferase [Listeria monocytogenes]EJO3820806.1 DNA cytosine methyltransferase [Listeria monocytogenes]EKL6026118.1 DNA cytosine methyltransferase [Listeria monocytogenes]
MNWGTMQNGEFLTAKITESHKTENACSLWQILESPEQVPESFYLSDEKTAQLIAKADFSKNQIGNLLETDSFGGNPQIGRVYNVEGTSPALNTMTGGGRVPKIAIPVLTPGREEKRQDGRRFKDVGEEMFTLTAQDIHGVLIPIREATKRGYALAKAFDSVNLAMPNSKTRRGRVGDQIANTLDTSCNQGVVVPVGNINPSGKGMNGNVYSDEGISPTLTTNKGEGVKVLQVGRGFNKGGVKSIAPALTKNSWQENNFLIDNIIWRIRKVMPIECFRLQSFPDWVFKAAEKVNSNSQLYKQAGNSVTVNIIEKIARLFKEETK